MIKILKKQNKKIEGRDDPTCNPSKIASGEFYVYINTPKEM